MTEGNAPGQCEFIPVLFEPGFEFRGRGLVSVGHILGEKLHLLGHAALDNVVFLVEAHGKRLAIEYFFSHAILNEARQLLGRGLALPLRGETHLELSHIIGRELYTVATRLTGVTPRAINNEQQRTDQQKMNQRLSPQAAEESPRERLALLCEFATP